MPFSEIRNTLLLASLFSFRLLGLFMILPVFAIYASEYQNTTPFLIGIAVGIYGLTQALCQLPLGYLSDRIGRKPILYIGLGLFALGSLIAGFAHQLMSIIIGRALQGSGAIGSTILAAASDLTSEQNRTKSMAIIGISIGATFSLAMILGPLIAAHYHLPGIFFLSLALALLGMIMTFMLPKMTTANRTHAPFTLASLKRTLSPLILFLNLSILLLHAILTANFIAIPLVFLHQLTIPKAQQWIIYIPILILSALLMAPFVRKTEKQAQTFKLFRFALYALCLGQLGISLLHFSSITLFASLLLFFTAFNILEALLPSLISHFAPAETRGTAMGLYSTCQFLGIFLGGLLGGFFYGQFSTTGVFLLGFSFSLLWLSLSFIFLPSGEAHGTRHQ